MLTRTDSAARTGVLKHLFDAYDRAWRRRHGVHRFDKIISLAIEPYRGQPRILADGTHLEPGDSLAIIHFNHDGFSTDSNRVRAALQFRRDLASSLRRLAKRLESDTHLQAVKALYGESWLPPHGSKVGFIVEPLPKTWRTRLQHCYVRLLLRIQFPHLARRGHDTWLHAYWLTRSQWQLLPQRLDDDRENRDSKENDDDTETDCRAADLPDL